jgi:alkylation response protein AidB-like acyl-CoA dehydrogenase
VNFALTDEQLLLQRTARDFVQRVCPPRTAKEWDETYTTPAELFQAFVDLEWMALPFPEELGGVGAGAIETALVVEELGRASFDVAMCFVTTLIPALTVLRWGDEPLRTELIHDVMSGKRRLATAISEPGAGSDVSALNTTAVPKGDMFVVNGTKMWCTGAGVPNTTIAAYVRTTPGGKGREGISLLLLDPTLPGITLRQIPTLARHTLGTYEVVLADVEVPRTAVVGPVDEGWKILLSGLDLERVLITAGYVGAAQSTLDEAVAYAKEREQFGRPIGDFQALSHALADVHTEVAASRLLTYHAAWLHDAGHDSATAGSMAKLYASETYVKAARWGMQVMAGYGFSTESVMSFRWRESIVATISGGTSQMQRNAIARSLGFRTR